MRTLKLVTALSVAGAMSLTSYVPVQAAPITPLSAAAKPNTQDGGSTIQVRWGGWGWGWGVGAGIGALASAALIGAAIGVLVLTSAYRGIRRWLRGELVAADVRERAVPLPDGTADGVDDRAGGSLDRRHDLSDRPLDRRLAGLRVAPVDQHRARRAEAGSAAELRPVQTDDVAEHP